MKQKYGTIFPRDLFLSSCKLSIAPLREKSLCGKRQIKIAAFYIFTGVLMLSKDLWNLFWQMCQRILSWLNPQLAVAVWGTRNQETRIGHPGLSGDKIIFEAHNAAHVTENQCQWEWDAQHCMRVISLPAASTVPLVGKGRQQHGSVFHGLCQLTSAKSM